MFMINEVTFISARNRQP